MSGISRGKPATLVPLIGFTRVEEGLDSFGTKDFILLILHSPSCCSIFFISLTSTLELKRSQEFGSLIMINRFGKV